MPGVVVNNGSLFGNYEIVVLFALLHDEILAGQQVAVVYHLVECGKFLFVYHDASALRELAHLAFRGEYGGLLGGEFYGLYAVVQLIERDFVGGYTGKYIEEGRFVELVQGIGRSVSEEYVRCFDGLLIFFFAMYEDGNLASQSFLERTQVRSLLLLCNERL